MAFSIKPLLGQGTLKVYSVFDEGIDWKATAEMGGPTQEQYTDNPWPHLYPECKLVFKGDQAPSPFVCRAPSESDLVAINSSRRISTADGKVAMEADPRKENLDLFQRCALEVQNYHIDNLPVALRTPDTVKRAPDGCELADPAACDKIPYVIRAEIGAYLQGSQEVSADLKND